MSRAARGFTLIELAIVGAVAAVLVPLVFQFWRTGEAIDREISAKQAFAASVRTVSEELRRDLRLGVSPGLAFAGDAECGAVTYVAGEDGVLVRRSTGCGDRFVARDVERVELGAGTVTLHFARGAGGPAPVRSSFTIGLPGVTP